MRAPDPTPDERRLLDRYPQALVRAGSVHPVAITPWTAALTSATRVRAAPPVDEVLRAAGRPYLEALRAANPAVFDGPVLTWLRTTPTALDLAPGTYFDTVLTCDAVRAEWLDAGGDGADGGDGGDGGDEDAAAARRVPLRRRVHATAGDPLVSGVGRSAALGASVIVTHPCPRTAETVFVLGLRSGRNASDVGRWHVAPSGMVEPADDQDPLTATVGTELVEELGLRLDRAEIHARASVLGVVHDLLRLRPDVVIRLRLTAAEGAGLAPGPEFAELARIGTSPAALRSFWERWTPDRLTPAAAGAVALLETALPLAGEPAEPAGPA